MDTFKSHGASRRHVSATSTSTSLLGVGLPILSRITRGVEFTGGANRAIDEITSRHTEAAVTSALPLLENVGAGKNTYTYDAHTYHTKVPPQGIAEVLQHYLPNGGLVLDPFAGSGMTGVAAASLGLDAALNELSPAAAFIASQYLSTIEPDTFRQAYEDLLRTLDGLRRELFTTSCRECGDPTELLYTVWSYEVHCNHCGEPFLLWDHARHYGDSVREHKILSEFECPVCAQLVKKSALSRSTAHPVLVGYRCCTKGRAETTAVPDERDLALIASIEQRDIPHFYPTDHLPDGDNLNQPKRHGLDRVDKFYTKRVLLAAATTWDYIERIKDQEVSAALAFVFTSLYRRVTKFSEFRFWGGSGNAARLNVPFIYDEPNFFRSFERKARSIHDHFATATPSFSGHVNIRIGDATDLRHLPSSSVDFIFTDPPFGGNINYSEMNLLWESWLRTRTESANEVIMNRHQQKGVSEYGHLMNAAMAECSRVLRDGHWMVVVFMNSSSEVWEEIRRSIVTNGFEIRAANVFDKKHGTFKHFVSPNTPGQDLMLHCLKVTGSESNGIPAALSLEDFLGTRDPANYVVGYEHVRRSPELDERRLYSEWTAAAMVNGQGSMSFAEFRQELDALRSSSNWSST